MLTLLAMNGAHPKVLQELAGHSGSQVSMGIHAYVSMGSKREAVNIVPAIF